MPAPARPRLRRHIAEEVDGDVKFAAFTGKAASVMRGKGCHGASTIHSLIYRARESGEEIPSFDLWDEAPASKAELIIIDECSMVDAELGRDLLSFGVPVLVLGDPAQLPPIQGGGFFTEAEPDVMLTEVHRQAQDDPDRAAVDGHPRRRISRARPLRRDRGRAQEPISIRSACSTPTRCWSGATPRAAPTTRACASVAASTARCRRPATSWCACATTARRACSTAGYGRVKERGGRRRKTGIMTMRLLPDDETATRGVKVSVRPECFTGGIEQIDWQRRKPYDEFDYGYVLTVHKAQGSQWDDVVLFDECICVSRQPRAMALYGRNAGREKADCCNVGAKIRSFPRKRESSAGPRLRGVSEECYAASLRFPGANR